MFRYRPGHRTDDDQQSGNRLRQDGARRMLFCRICVILRVGS
jgi:hypothetical protein